MESDLTAAKATSDWLERMLKRIEYTEARNRAIPFYASKTQNCPKRNICNGFTAKSATTRLLQPI